MLVLTRKEGEAIIIDRDVRVVVLSNDHRGVRLGIEAPAARTILREELLREVVAENQRAAATGELEWTATLAPQVLQVPPVETPAAD